jgi:HPt (histidine-containing phosphotransfer) domain-containing protein
VQIIPSFVKEGKRLLTLQNILALKMIHEKDDNSDLINLKHLQQQTLHDSALQRDILLLFIEQCRVSLKTLQLFPDTPLSLPDLQRLLHTTKGSARNIGAFPLAEAMASCEANLLSSVSPDFQELQQLLRQTQEKAEIILQDLTNQCK